MNTMYAIVDQERNMACRANGYDDRFEFKFHNSYEDFLSDVNILLFQSIEQAKIFKNKINKENTEIYKIVTPDNFMTVEEGRCNIEIIGNGNVTIVEEQFLGKAYDKNECVIKGLDGEPVRCLNTEIYTILTLQSGYAHISRHSQHEEGYSYSNVEVGAECFCNHKDKTITYYWKINSENGGRDCDGPIARHSFHMSMGGFKDKSESQENWGDEFNENKYEKIWKFNSKWTKNIFTEEKNYIRDTYAEEAGY